jgi:hypothetical protein
MTRGTEHPGEHGLRRFHVGEFSAAERSLIEQHLGDCGPCRARLGALGEEQRAFEKEIPFGRFAGGVERARRVPRPSRHRPWFFGLGLSTLAAAAVLVMARPVSETNGNKGINKTKGAENIATLVLRIAKADGTQQRVAAPADVLRPGDVMRLGYRVTRGMYMAVLSIDDTGTISFIEPASGPARAVPVGDGVSYLPDSIAFDGTGRERLTVFLAPDSFDAAKAAEALRAAALESNHNLATMAPPKLGVTRGAAETASWLLQKP